MKIWQNFFRYNLSKINEDATLYDEIQLVDRYIYILNVRFAGDIHYQKEVEEGIGDVIVPSMILQPLVENAVQYGIRDVEWEGIITLFGVPQKMVLCIWKLRITEKEWSNR